MIVGASTPMECFTFLQVLPYLDSLVTSLIPLVCVGACRVSVLQRQQSPAFDFEAAEPALPLSGGRQRRYSDSSTWCVCVS